MMIRFNLSLPTRITHGCTSFIEYLICCKLVSSDFQCRYCHVCTVVFFLLHLIAVNIKNINLETKKNNQSTHPPQQEPPPPTTPEALLGSEGKEVFGCSELKTATASGAGLAAVLPLESSVVAPCFVVSLVSRGCWENEATFVVRRSGGGKTAKKNVASVPPRVEHLSAVFRLLEAPFGAGLLLIAFMLVLHNPEP